MVIGGKRWLIGILVGILLLSGVLSLEVSSLPALFRHMLRRNDRFCSFCFFYLIIPTDHTFACSSFAGDPVAHVLCLVIEYHGFKF